MLEHTHWSSRIQDSEVLSKIESLPTPFYFYDLEGVAERGRQMRNLMPNNVKIHFALKANYNPHVLRQFLNLGFGVDCVSQGEVNYSLKQGFSTDAILFSGVAKSQGEVDFAIHVGVGGIHIESEAELIKILSSKSRRPGQKVNVGVRLNPGDLQVDTLKQIKTSGEDTKFGLTTEEWKSVIALVKENREIINLKTLSLHLGSQLFSAEPYRHAIQFLLAELDSLAKEGIFPEALDLGGGFGIKYDSQNWESELDLIRSVATAVREIPLIQNRTLQILLEPGRFLVGHFGILVSEIQSIKKVSGVDWLLLDAGMSHLIRPMLYGARHMILSLRASAPPIGASKRVTIAGPICESTDLWGHDFEVGPQKIGDRLVILDAGAYGAVMSSQYNMRGALMEYSYSKSEGWQSFEVGRFD